MRRVQPLALGRDLLSKLLGSSLQLLPPSILEPVVALRLEDPALPTPRQDAPDFLNDLTGVAWFTKK